MPRATCPVCAAELHLNRAEAALGRRVICPECGAALAVVEVDPLELEEVPDFEEELEEDEF
ncbi:MAG: lysine biosynthesis protein LysW [Candidatus Bipolaricaulaceae bacterium]